MTQVTDALAAHLAAFQKNRVYPDAEQERKQLSSEIELFFQERKSTLIMSEGERTKLREDLQNAKDQLASMTKIREDAAFQIRNLEARVRGFQYDVSKARKDRLEMMRHARLEILNRDGQIARLEPKVEAYDLLRKLTYALSGSTVDMMESRSHFLRRLEEEIGKAEVEVDAENAKAAAKVEAELPDFLKTKKG